MILNDLYKNRNSEVAQTRSNIYILISIIVYINSNIVI
jgi:hypothetical protein